MFKRILTQKIQDINKTFPVLLITGPRQVGKTTLLEICAEDKRNYVTLDDLQQRELARNDPALFLQSHKTPLVIDEVQYAPELFSAIKIIVDREKKKRIVLAYRITKIPFNAGHHRKSCRTCCHY